MVHRQHSNVEPVVCFSVSTDVRGNLVWQYVIKDEDGSELESHRYVIKPRTTPNREAM